MKRRTFLAVGAGVGGALFVGWALVPPRQRLVPSTGRPTPNGTVALNGWLTIAADDTVTVVVPKAEMGQGIHTALAMVIAEELGCAWEQIRIAFSPIDAIYNNISAIVEGLPFHPDANGPLVRGVKWFAAKSMREVGVMMTGGSSSILDCWMPMREAGASARQSLLAAAATKLGVDVSTCRVENGAVVCGTSKLRFGELAESAVAHRPDRITLKTMADFSLLGKPVPRLDADAKSRGAAVYTADVVVPGMRYAAVALSPTFGGTPRQYNAEVVQRMPGVRAVITLTGSHYGDAAGIAVIADAWWQAKQGVDALVVQWSEGPHASLSSIDIMRTLREAAATDDGLPFRAVGDARAALTRASRVIEATYEAPYLAHTAMEPLSATVRITKTSAEIWVGTQVPGLARAAVAQVAGLDADQVTVHQYVIGGSFGRRLDVDFVAQAAAIAMALPDTAVHVQWRREDDIRHDTYRPAAVSTLRAGIDAQGRVTAITAHSASQSAFQVASMRLGIPLARFIPDRTTAEGTWDQPYEFATLRSAHKSVSLPVPVGQWRSVGHSHQAFFFECFLDEIAFTLKQDPVAFRASLLQQHPRALHVLTLAAERSGWGQPLAQLPNAPQRARGIALHSSFGTTVAQVVDVSVSDQRRIRVHRVVAVIDCGFAVNPNIITQQIEGAICYGLSAALDGEITIANGRVTQGNFHEYRPLRMSETPRIDTVIVPSMEMPSGVGEPGLPPLAPAVANAVFALTGTRLRALPLRLPATGASV
jgi:isoquinoline 1-oxidoreductase subunit beta